jgi:hypothetical protein
VQQERVQMRIVSEIEFSCFDFSVPTSSKEQQEENAIFKVQVGTELSLPHLIPFIKTIE